MAGGGPVGQHGPAREQDVRVAFHRITSSQAGFSRPRVFFFLAEKGRSREEVWPPALSGAPRALTVRSGLCPRMLIRVRFEKSVLLLKSRSEPSGLFPNPRLEVIHLECLYWDVYAHFK